MRLLSWFREFHERHPLILKALYILCPLGMLLFYIPSSFFPAKLGTGWGFGFAGILVIYCLHLFLHKFQKQRANKSPLSDLQQNISFRHNRWVSSLVYIVIFCGVVAFLKNVDISWEHYDQKGFILIAYSICRFILAIFIIILCSTLGALIFKCLFPDIQRSDVDDGTFFILCFFGGAAIYGLVFTGIGLAGFLELPVALALTVPILFFSPPFINEIAGSFFIRTCCAYVNLKGLNVWIYLSLAWCLLITAVLLLLFSGLYPGPTSNDVWEHYLQYYREVLQNGSVGPNEVWYHFYVSKGAGLFFLFGLLSDTLAPQLVSWCFVCVTGLLVYKMAYKLLDSSSWALLSSIIFFAVYRGDFFKHHDVMSGFVAFLLWGSIEIETRTKSQRNAFFLFMGVVAFYIGFYQPVSASIIAVFWGILFLFTVPFEPGRAAAYNIARLVVILVTGTIATLGVNCFLTGMAEAVPIKFWWSLADNEKFRQVFGYSGIAYLLKTESGNLIIQPRFQLEWFAAAFRYRYLLTFLPPGLVAMGGAIGIVKMTRGSYWEKDRLNGYPTRVFSAFFFSVTVFCFLIYSASFLRLLVFTTFFSTIIIVVLLKILLDFFSSPATRPWVFAFFLTILGIHAFGQDLWYYNTIKKAYSHSVISFLAGKKSFADVQREIDMTFQFPLKLYVVSEIRRVLGPERKIMNLGYDPGPGYSFPGSGIFAEVDCSLGPDHLDIVFGSPDRAKSILRNLGIDFFLLNLQSRFFNSLVFGQLFDPQNMNKYFKVIFHKGDNYLLTWRTSRDNKPIHPRFAQVMELKQRGVLSYPNSPEFKRQLGTLIRRDLSAWSRGNTAASMEVIFLLRSHMMDGVTITENRQFISDLISFTSSKLRQGMEAIITEVKHSNGLDSLEEKERGEVFHREIVKKLMVSIKSWSREYCEVKFGRELARTLVTSDERKPFGEIYTGKREVQEYLAEMKTGLVATPFEYY